jgi:hypothetical protein
MSEIIIEFKASGHGEIIDAMNQIKAAQSGVSNSSSKTSNALKSMTAKIMAQGKTWKDLGVSVHTYRGAAKGSRLAMEKLRIAMQKNKKVAGGLLRNNRLLAGSFATMRSKLLLFNFMMGLGVQQIIKMAKEATKLKNMETAFDSLTGASESSAAGIAKLRSATRGTVSDFDLLQQANNAMILGVTKNTNEMSHMFDMAKRLGDALGRDTASSVESLITGIGRQSRMMLDNIGIVVKADDAYRDYAKELNKTAGELTDTEKKQAFLNATLAAAEDKVKKLPPTTKKASDQFNKFGATMRNLGLEIGTGIAPALGNFAEQISDFINEMMLSDLELLAEDLAEVGVSAKALSGITDAISMDKALDSLDDNIDKFEDLTEKTDSGLNALSMTLSKGMSALGSQSDMSQFNTFVEAFDKMGQDLFINQQETGIIAFFDDIQNLESDKLIAGSKVIVEEMLVVGNTIAQDQIKLRNFKNELKADPGNTFVEGQIEKLEKNIEVNETIIKRYKTHINTLAEIISATLGYEKAMNFLSGTVDENNKKIIENADAFKTSKPELDEEALLRAKLATIEEDLTNVLGKQNESQQEKLKSDKKAIKLSQDKIAVTKKLSKIELDADLQKLKAAKAVVNFTGKAMEAFGANAKEMAYIEATMAVIDAYGAYLKTLNSEMMKTNPIATKVLAGANLAAGLVAAGVIIAEANKLGASQSSADEPSIYGSFEQGGYVGGRRHSAGGTLIEAEKGEFVMNRNAVDSIGLETLNQMNQTGSTGNVVVNVSGNILTRDYVEGELAESIKEAVRRGSDFGMS